MANAEIRPFCTKKRTLTNSLTTDQVFVFQTKNDYSIYLLYTWLLVYPRVYKFSATNDPDI